MYLPVFKVTAATDQGIIDFKVTTNDKKRAAAMVQGKYPTSHILKVTKAA